MFGWFRKRAARPQPEARWVIDVEPTRLCIRDGDGVITVIDKAEISAIAIETNDTGPWGTDLWWLVFGAEDRLVAAYPQGATGAQAALDFLFTLDGFAHEEMVKAMGSTQNAVFAVWRRRA